ncbi:DNA polymerase/3'-5' exonuclease PolX [Pedobacter sp. SD-b]|uniref:DNA polymerase/3'-5' exonuclease PolX n=1 Tax=Pedobacter segetis TaxID=2793069 RepID=A0ABS1BHP8_9SPHI|nr:DNA polymerase/3'-5' exonuclease PolX [Pedobacter segetis]MBK0382408.1 DNA polymerase/3'-5' exonuclease PolX [Pedobacter segetis]
MENKEISKAFKLLSQLMELYQENPFKIKSIANASFKIDKLPFKLKDKDPDELEKIEGIGKSIAAKIAELLQTGEIQELNTLISKTPDGILGMMTIKGLGPKKIEIIWNVLDIETIGELYYACNENRLIEAKGFGLKTQEEIKKAIEFKMANMGRFLYAKLENIALSYQNEFVKAYQKIDSKVEVLITGQFRRKCEIIDVLSFLVVSNNDELLLDNFPDVLDRVETNLEKREILFQDSNGIKIQITICKPEEKGNALFKTTGSDLHLSLMENHFKSNMLFDNEEDLYQSAGMDFIVPELREGFDEVELALKQQLPKLIVNDDLKGTLHNHSTWSDGVHSIEEMALYCRDEMNLEYLGMCDHSKTAVYAKGLSIERVLQQHEEIDHLNKKLAPFKIFKGIESDILSDGSLDYPEEILKRFDFVVASVHSVLKMDEERATNRLIKAIENPYTTILGHPTGRLLLSRSGYPLNFEKVIDACAANKVVIEINANPLRLDLDWRWHRYALEKGVLLSINPDAHRTEGLLDMQYGINVARKGGLTPSHCLNALTLKEIVSYFNSKKA